MTKTKTKPAAKGKDKPENLPAKKPGGKPPKPKPAPAPTEEPAGEWKAMAVPLDSLDLSVAEAVRCGTNEEAEARYAERYAQGLPMPAVACTTWADAPPDAPYLVADGGHRVRAARQAGKASLDAAVLVCPTQAAAEREAWAIAYKGNAEHGLPRTSADLRQAVRSALLREPPASKDRAIAAKVACNKVVVMKVRVAMTEAGELTGKASAEGRYTDSDMHKWLTGKGKRPGASEPKSEPETGRAATPPDEPTAEADGWRDVPVADMDLPAATVEALSGAGVGATAGAVADALDGGTAIPGLDDWHAADLKGTLAAVRADGLVTADAPAESLPVAGLNDDPASAGRAATPSVPTDEKGRPVPPFLLSVFAKRKEFRGLSQQFGAAIAAAEKLAGDPAGAAIQRQSMRQYAADLSLSVAGGMPYVVCPSCDGTGRQGPQCCPTCKPGDGGKKGRGWVSRLVYGQFGDELKAVCDGPWTESPQETAA